MFKQIQTMKRMILVSLVDDRSGKAKSGKFSAILAQI